MLAAGANGIIRLLLGPVCAACKGFLDRPLISPVCAACWCAIRALTPPCCDRCGDSLPSSRAPHLVCARCQRQPPEFELGRSAGLYEGSLRAIIHAFKYERRRVLAGPLANLMRAAGAELLNGADAVAPVPLHPWRSFERGFNQADDLARCMGLPVWRALRRREHRPPQAGLPASERHLNVKRAFTPRGGLSTGLIGLTGQTWPTVLRGRTVVLIDDVMTTGATLNACSRALLEGGVRNVRVLTAARAVAARPRPPRQPRDLSTAQHR